MHYGDRTKQTIESDYIKRLNQWGRLMRSADTQISALTDEELQTYVKFIFTHLPFSDLAEATMFTTVLDYARTARKAREQMPWGKEIPMDIFLTDVLFPRVNNEWLEPARGLFYDLLAPRVKDKSLAEAVIETNYFCFEQATYVGSDMRTVPPTTMLKSARGRCGEESVFAVMALRSIGIPARQIYVPRWAHCDDNHAWVEVWCDGDWHYLGACEPEEELDRGWFTSASSRAMLAESKAFCPEPQELSGRPPEPLRSGIQYLVNRTAHYAPAVKLQLWVRDQNGRPMPGIRIIPELINAAKLDPVGLLITDAQGYAEITIGRGSVCLHLTDGSSFMDQWINTAKSCEFEVAYKPENPGDKVTDFDTIAPVITGKTNPPLSKETLKRQQANTEKALKIRREKEAGFFDGGHFPEDREALLGRFAEWIEPENLRDILVKARGNYPEIIGFLEANQSRYAAVLLKTLNDKDYSDCRKEILTAHLKHAVKYAGCWAEEIFADAVLAPRIYFEHMTDYRETLAAALSEEQKARFRENPLLLWDYIEANIVYQAEEETTNILATPAAVMSSGYGSLMSKKILFTAILRTLGIPARMTRETLNIEYYNGTEFVPVIDEEKKDSRLLLRFDGDNNWTYGFNWSVSTLRNQVFEPLDLRGGVIGEKQMTVDLPSGRYRVITTNRLPNGNTYSRQYDTVLEPEAVKELAVSLRPVLEKDMISKARINDFVVQPQQGDPVLISGRLSKGQNVLIWLLEDHEPSQHILNELIAAHSHFTGTVPVTFILGSKAAADNGLIAKAAGLLHADIVTDPELASAEPSARLTFVDPDKLPLAIVTDEQFHTSYAVSGYNVGTVEMMLKILAMIC